MDKDLTAIVTGAASGIGRATAELMASRGFRLALIDRSVDGLEQTVVTRLPSGASVNGSARSTSW